MRTRAHTHTRRAGGAPGGSGRRAGGKYKPALQISRTLITLIHVYIKRFVWRPSSFAIYQFGIAADPPAGVDGAH